LDALGPALSLEIAPARETDLPVASEIITGDPFVRDQKQLR
jgi:hypothetical protein